MPIPTFTGLGPNPQYDDVVRKVNTLVLELRNIILSLDSLNVVSLTADNIDAGTLNAGVVTIRSNLAGGAYIVIDGTGIHVFDGVKETLTVDVNGDLSTQDGIITGGTVRTGASGARIEFASNQMKTYNSSNQLMGMVLGPSDAGFSYGDAFFYDSGTKVMEFFNNLGGTGYTIRPAGSASLALGRTGFTTFADGTWAFRNYNGILKGNGSSGISAIAGITTSVSVVTSVNFGSSTTTSSTLNFTNGVLTSVT